MAFDEILATAARTPFYRGRITAGVAWSDLPLTRRADLVRDQLAQTPFGTRHPAEAEGPVRLGKTGGADDLLLLGWSERALAGERRAGARMLASIGLEPSTAIANTLPGALVSPGSLLFGDVVEEHGALDVPLGAIESDAAAKQAWELVDRVTPGVLCLEISTAARFLAAAPPAPRPWLRGVLWLRRAGDIAPLGGRRAVAAAEIPAQAFTPAWQRVWLSVPEAASFTAWTCGKGVFHADSTVIAEVVDGVLALTPREADASLLRYDSGLPATRVASCECGGGEALSVG